MCSSSNAYDFGLVVNKEKFKLIDEEGRLDLLMTFHLFSDNYPLPK